jgi:hypothetical protein
MSSERFRPAETPSEQTPGLERASRGQGEAARRRRRRGGGTGPRDERREPGARDAREAPVARQEPAGHGPHDARAAHGGQSTHGHGDEVELRPGWSRPKPEHVPNPTYWPAVLALGVTFLVWGLITSYVISAVGLALFGLALGGWIWEMRHDG